MDDVLERRERRCAVFAVVDRRFAKASTGFVETAAGLPAAKRRAPMRLHIWMCLTCVLFLLTEGLFGQEYRGSLSGRVLDPSGAAVPGAHLTLTNIATNVRLTTDTNGEGHYTLPYLQPATYSLRAEHEGFKACQRSPIEIRIDVAVTVDARLELGSSAETVNVQSETPLLDIRPAPRWGQLSTPSESWSFRSSRGSRFTS
jgi:hypothetical protein